MTKAIVRGTQQAVAGRGGMVRQSAAQAAKQRAYDLTISSLPTVYGCSGILDMCDSNDLMSLSFEGAEPFMDWVGWQSTRECIVKRNFVIWVGPSGTTTGSPTSSVISDPCADPATVEWGDCDFQLSDFARLRRAGPTRDITKTGLQLCAAQPRFRRDGTPIANDMEYDMRLATEVVLQDLKRLMVVGNKSVAGEFDGLERLVKTGYIDSRNNRCTAMDSTVVDWNDRALAGGGSGPTINGAPLATTWNFIDVLAAVYQRIRARIRWAPALDAQPLDVGDMVLLWPSDYIDCLLNHYTCWRVCSGTQYNESAVNTYEGRTFRENLNGGMFGAGRIFIHGFEIPILPYDWGLLKGPGRFDAYLLTGKVGGVRLISGEYNDMAVPASEAPQLYDVTDGGRLLTWIKNDHTCVQRVIEMQPRLMTWAPWAQARFVDLACDTVLPPLSPDPRETSYFYDTSFNLFGEGA